MARGANDSLGALGKFIFMVFGLVDVLLLLALVLPGDALLCVGKRDGNNSLYTAVHPFSPLSFKLLLLAIGIVMVAVGSALVVLPLALACICLSNQFQHPLFIAIGIAAFLLGVGPGLGCGLGY